MRSILPGSSRFICSAGASTTSSVNLDFLTSSARSDRWARIKRSSRRSKLFSPSKHFCSMRENRSLGLWQVSRIPRGMWLCNRNFIDFNWSCSISWDKRSKKLWNGLRRRLPVTTTREPSAIESTKIIEKEVEVAVLVSNLQFYAMLWSVWLWSACKMRCFQSG